MVKSWKPHNRSLLRTVGLYKASWYRRYQELLGITRDYGINLLRTTSLRLLRGVPVTPQIIYKKVEVTKLKGVESSCIHRSCSKSKYTNPIVNIVIPYLLLFYPVIPSSDPELVARPVQPWF